jgi:hypothetical protein
MIHYTCPCCEVSLPTHRDGCTFHADAPDEAADFDEVATLRAGASLAIETAVRSGGVSGDHHKAWVIDQMVRALAGDRYDAIVKAACNDGEYDWDVGVAP